MSDPVERFVLSRTLWTMVAPPLLALLWHLVGGIRGAYGPRRNAWAQGIGIGTAALSTIATSIHVVRFEQAPPGSPPLYEHLGWSGGPGPFGAGFDLSFDRYSGVACLLACFVALTGAGLLTSQPRADRGWPVWAWLSLALAGALTSFLAGGLLTVCLGWAGAAAAGAWIAGWSDRRVGAVRATRGVAGIIALVVGGLLLWQELAVEPSVASLAALAGPSSVAQAVGIRETVTGLPALSFPEIETRLAGAPAADLRDGLAFALVALLAAVSVTSASTPSQGAPRTLAAIASGATTSALGPVLLLRLRSLIVVVSHGGALVAVTGVLMIIAAAVQSLSGAKGPLKWLALVGGLPAGLTCISLGTDGPQGALLVLVAAGLVAVLLPFTTVLRAISMRQPTVTARPGIDEVLLLYEPERVGAMLINFEHWVVSAIAGAIGVFVHASAWVLARFDSVVLSGPSDRVADSVVRFERRIEPILGGSMVRMAWMIVAVLGLSAVAHAVWQMR